MADIKIFLACHKNDINIPQNDLLYPVQVGTALSNVRFDRMAHDDDGDNISHKNKYYCELTAQYWAWKNVEADYYGFFHYRRYLSFASKHYPSNHFAEVVVEANDDTALKKFNINESAMREIIESNDFVVPEPGGFLNNITMRQQYQIAWQHHEEDLNTILDIIGSKYPEMLETANSYLEGKKGYFCNMFIMKKSIFDQYCQWLFDILEEHERRCDFSMYDPTSYRVSGYLAERLCGIYITYLKNQRKYRYVELQRVYFEDVSCQKPIKPLFGKDAVALVLSSSDFFVPYLSTLLQSIKENSSQRYQYEIIILHQDIEARNQEILRRQVVQKNIQIRFFNITSYMRGKKDNLALRGHFAVETYFRLLLPDILTDWDKVLYLDSDMVVMRDIAELYNTDVTGFLLAAVRDADTAGLYNGAEPGKKEYMDNVLKIKNPYGYFQAGTILFNLDEFRKSFTVEELFAFASSYKWELLDQDVLNYFAQGRVKYIATDWNVMMDWRGMRIAEFIGSAPRPLYLEYMEARKHPAICHYAGPEKPWMVFDQDMGELFWDYARRTPYYELILARGLFTPARTSVWQRFKERIWDMLYPFYDKKFPKNTKERESLGYLYRRIRRRL